MKRNRKVIPFDAENSLKGRKLFWQLDGMSKRRGRLIWVFIGESIYFIVSLAADYKEPVYMTSVAAMAVMLVMLLYMISFTTIEGEDWRPVYRKIKYFPIDRKKYLLAKVWPAALIVIFQTGVLWLSFLCRFLMNRAVDIDTAIFVTLYMAASGICYFVGFLVLFVLGAREGHGFDILKSAIMLFIAVIGVINVI